MDIHATAQLLGSLGEFFGAIAVVVTLVYLAIQVGNSARESRLEGQARAMELSNTALMLRTSPEGSRIWLAGLSTPDELTAEEKHSFFNMLLVQVNAIQITQLNKQSSRFLMDLDVNPLGELAAFPGFGQWYRAHRKFLSHWARGEIDALLSSLNED